MLKKIKHFFYNFFYSIPFAMKAGDNEIFKSSVDTDNKDVGIHRHMFTRNLYEALLKGELTEEVKKLRFRTYLIDREAKKKKYDKNSTCKYVVNNADKTYYEFTQANSVVCTSIGDELNRIGEYQASKMFLKIQYEDFCKFKHEDYIKSIDVYLDKQDKTKSFAVLHYSIYIDETNSVSRIFNNYLKNKDKYKNNDAYPIFKEISFVTQNAVGIDDLYNVKLKSLQYDSIETNNGEYLVKYNISDYSIEDLTEKFFDKEQNDKYINKERKKVLELHF